MKLSHLHQKEFSDAYYSTFLWNSRLFSDLVCWADFEQAETLLETEDTQPIDEEAEAFIEDDLSFANDMFIEAIMVLMGPRKHLTVPRFLGSDFF